MPERNILRIYGNWVYGGIGEANRYQYYAPIHQETGRTLNICRSKDTEEYLVGRVNSILNSGGEVLIVANVEERFRTYQYTNRLGNLMYAVVLPESLVSNFGIREGEYLDVTFTEVSGPSAKDTSGGKWRMSKPIFPKMLRYGELSIQPKSALPQVIHQLPEVLIEKKFTSQFYSTLVFELNIAYGYGLTRSTLILYRALLENLLVELLRAKFGMQKSDMFFNSARGRFHDFSVLIDNLRSNLAEFKPYSAVLDAAFANRLSKYKEIANANAHHLEIRIPRDFFLSNKDDMNFVCSLLVDVIEKITSRKL